MTKIDKEVNQALYLDATNIAVTANALFHPETFNATIPQSEIVAAEQHDTLTGALGPLNGWILALLTAIGFIIAKVRDWYYFKTDLAEKQRFEQLDDAQKRQEMQLKRSWFIPSRSRLFPWSMRLFMAAQSGAVIGLIIGSVLFPGLGSLLGTIIGATFSIAVLACIYYSSKKPRNENDYVHRTVRVFRQESPHDIPWDARLYSGVFAGLTLGAAVGALIPLPGATAIAAMAGVIILGATAVASPLVFHLLRKHNLIRPSDNSTNLNRPNETQRRWYTQSQMETPWYVRIYFGGNAGALLGAALGTLVMPGLGTLVGTLAGSLVGCAIAYIAPKYLAYIANQSYLSRVFQENLRQAEIEKQANSLNPDYAASIRCLGGAFSGMLIGAGIGSILPGVGTAIGGAIGALIGGSVALAQPMLYALGRRYFPSRFTPEAPANKLPSFVRTTLGVLIGSVLGSVVPGIGTVLGGMIGGLAAWIIPWGIKKYHNSKEATQLLQPNVPDPKEPDDRRESEVEMPLRRDNSRRESDLADRSSIFIYASPSIHSSISQLHNSRDDREDSITEGTFARQSASQRDLVDYLAKYRKTLSIVNDASDDAADSPIVEPSSNREISHLFS